MSQYLDFLSMECLTTAHRHRPVDHLLCGHQRSSRGCSNRRCSVLPPCALSHRLLEVRYLPHYPLPNSPYTDTLAFHRMDSTLGWLMFYILNTGVITWCVYVVAPYDKRVTIPFLQHLCSHHCDHGAQPRKIKLMTCFMPSSVR